MHLVEKDPSKVYCFVIIPDDVLLIQNCNTKHSYICEGSKGKELKKSRSRFRFCVRVVAAKPPGFAAA